MCLYNVLELSVGVWSKHCTVQLLLVLGFSAVVRPPLPRQTRPLFDSSLRRGGGGLGAGAAGERAAAAEARDAETA